MRPTRRVRPAESGHVREPSTRRVRSTSVGTAQDLQRLVGNAATVRIQRLVGAEGSAQEGKKVAFTVDDDFLTKHVADTADGARRVTEARIATGGPPGMVNGTAPNNVAKKADWVKAIDESDAEVPPDGEWEGINGDDGQFVNQLAKVEVAGWEAQGKAGAVAVKTTVNKKFVGGDWKVTGCEFDKDEDYVDGSGSVEMEISHLTS